MVKADSPPPHTSLPWVDLVLPFVPNSSFVYSTIYLPECHETHYFNVFIVPWKKGFVNITKSFKNIFECIHLNI